MTTGDGGKVRPIIETVEDLASGIEALAAAEPVFAEVFAQTGIPPLRRRSDGFEAVLQAIVGQQVSIASAGAIWGRLEEAGLVRQEAVAAADEAALRACGLSRPKVRYALALAESSIDYKALRGMPDSDVIRELTQLLGIGQWTAEVYALASLGRVDVFPAGDLALQEAAKLAFDLPARPTEKEMAALAQAWSPWRAVAARLLWAYYRVAKNREGML